MMGWLKKRLRRWLLDSEAKPVDRLIPVRIGSAIWTVEAREVIGLKLSCIFVLDGKTSVILVGAEQAFDKAGFWRLWKELGGKASWEDGTRFEPIAERH